MILYIHSYPCLIAAFAAIFCTGVSEASEAAVCTTPLSSEFAQCNSSEPAGEDWEIELVQLYSKLSHRGGSASQRQAQQTIEETHANSKLPVHDLINRTLSLRALEDSSFLLSGGVEAVEPVFQRQPHHVVPRSKPKAEDDDDDDIGAGVVRAVGDMGVRELLRFPAIAEAVSRAAGVHRLPEGLRILGRALVVTSGCALMIGCVLLLLQILRDNHNGPRKIEGPPPVKNEDPWGQLRVCLLFIVWEQISTDQYLPNMPQMMLDLDCSYAAISFTVSLVWIVKGITGLFVAPISDQRGRRWVMLSCCGLLVVSTLACGLAPDIYWFYAARVLHGIGESGIVVVGGVCRDLFDDPYERMAVMNAFGAALFAVPVISPCIGGLVGNLIGWRLVFGILSLGILSSWILLWWKFEETLQPNDNLEETYWVEVRRILTDRHMMCLVAVIALLLGLINFNDSNLSLILENTYHISVVKTSLLVGANAAALLPGFALAEVGNNNRGPLATVRITTLVLLIPAYAMAMVGLFASNSPTAFMSSLYPFNCLFAPVIVGCITLYQQPIKDTFAMATAIQLFFSTTIAATVVSLPGMELISFGHHVTNWCLWTAGVSITAVAIFWFGFGADPPAWAYEHRFPEEPEQEPDSYEHSPEAIKGKPVAA